ncbi:MAG: hypothetical protein HXY22_00125 [Alphaproteobacteria bacterium]|nr:hypothetical protein [Alphaproteobacteria bacterium]
MSADAYRQVLLARQFLNTGNLTRRIYEAALRLCERAVALDPRYAEAWCLIAHARERLQFQGIAGEDGMLAVERALALDGNLAMAHAIKARILSRKGDFAEAERAMARAMALDADSLHVVSARAGLHFLQRQFVEALPFYRRAADLNPRDCAQLGMICTIGMKLKDKDLLQTMARQLVERAEPIVTQEFDNTTVISWFVVGLGVLGQVERAREWIERAMIIDPDDFNMRYNFACASVQTLNDLETALVLLEETLNQVKAEALAWVKIDPDLDPLRDDPRFQALIATAEMRLAAR